MNIRTALNVVSGGYRDLGPVLHRLVVWKRACSSLALVMAGADPVIAPSEDFGADECGFHLKGERLAEFSAIEPYDQRNEYHTLVNFTLSASRIEGFIVPAVRPDGHDPVDDVNKFVAWHDNDEDSLFVYDINGSVEGSGGIHIQPGVLLLNRLALPLDEILWSEFEDGGDGSYHLHLVMTNGRFYRIDAGDFGS